MLSIDSKFVLDANDEPPKSCSVAYDRDCSEHGCIVSALENMASLRFISPWYAPRDFSMETNTGAENRHTELIHQL